MRLLIFGIVLASLAACSQKNESPTVTPTASSVAVSTAEFKAQPLEAAEEKRIIEAAQSQKADDGATVLQVLQYAEKLRPKEFKLAGFEMLYSNDGKPSTVGVCYWVGAKRLEGDQYCDIAYELSADRNSFKPSVGAATPEEQRELTVSKVRRGRDAFLKEVDNRYKGECVDGKKKLC